MIGLIGAMQIEVEDLIRQLEHKQETRIGMDTFVSGTLFGQEAVLAVCGPGKVNAALCTQSMIFHFSPEWIVNLGVAGSGHNDVTIGDMVIAKATVQHDMDTSPIGDPVGFVSKIGLIEIPCDPILSERLLLAAGKVENLKVHEGIIATGDQFVSRGDVRERIYSRFHALAIEMEGAAVAHACYMHGTPCGVLRSISDNADGSAEMDYPTFTKVAVAHSHQVIFNLLGGK